MNIEKIAETDWRDAKASLELVEPAQEILDALPPQTTMGTTKLVYALLKGADAMQMKRLLAALQHARDCGAMDGYFSRGKKGMTGHPLVLWHAAAAPVAKTLKEKQDMQDLLFGTNEFGNNPQLFTKEF